MNILAIETSCDETAAAVVADGKNVLSSVLATQVDVHTLTGGVVPEVAARLQLETIIPIIEQALAEAFTPKDSPWACIDAIAVTYGPGLMGSLLVGVETAKTLAYAKEKPLIPVNHLAGHLYGALGGDDFAFPYLGLIVSGNHTELVEMRGHHDFHLLGSTRDDAAGEAFDKVARLLGLPYPGGPEIDRLAAGGDPQAIDFPRAMLDQDNLDFSFSGLKTAVRREVEAAPLTKQRKADLAASFEAAVVEILVEKTRRATAQTNPRKLVAGGGVTNNSWLRKGLQKLSQELEVPLRLAPLALTTDNAAMIGLAAYFKRDAAADVFSVVADSSAPIAGYAPSPTNAAGRAGR